MIDLWGNITEQHKDGVKEKSLNIFDAVNKILSNIDLRTVDPLLKLYDCYTINNILGQNLGSVLYAGELNKLSELPKEMQHLIYLIMMPKVTSRSKYIKKSKDIELMKYFSKKIVKEMIYVLTDKEIAEIMKTLKERNRIKT